MESQTSKEVFDLLIITDATASMGNFIKALNQSLQDIIRVSVLTDCFERIGVLAYRDYCGGELLQWSSWYAADEAKRQIGQAALLKMAAGIRPSNGGDWPEATKTALARAYDVMRSEATTVILLYTDAPPHIPCNKSDNLHKEMKALMKGRGLEPKFADWVSACRIFQSGEKKAVAFCLVHSHLIDTLSPYLLLSTLTSGATFQLKRDSAADISELTMGILLTWMGVTKDGTVPNAATPTVAFKALKYISTTNIDQIKHEDDDLMKTFFLKRDVPDMELAVKGNVNSVDLTVDRLFNFVKPRATPLKDLSARYAADQSYRALVADQALLILQNDVRAMAMNPVFGTLWRTICNDRASERRADLLNEFGNGVNRLSDGEDKARMKAWLAESYNFAADCDAIIQEVAEEDKYPCLFLDPTLDFAMDNANAERWGDEATKNSSKFSRDELLEIGRSCDPRVLRRLGNVLTQLTYVQTKDDEPAHIREMPNDKLTRLPMALALSKYKRTFWEILLHVVLPGTKVSKRIGALLAALSLRMGIEPLRKPADAQLLAARNMWNKIDVPETWNSNCLSLLLEADRDYEARVSDGTTSRPALDAGVLTEADRALFRTLVEYRLLELNLVTNLTARVGWTPSKSRAALGPVMICHKCKFPRSMTIMAERGICGLCVVSDTSDSKCPCQVCAATADTLERERNDVSLSDTEETTKAWVECSVRSCRVQYVVYNPESLRVKPKCFYCRHDNKAAAVSGKGPRGPAPFVECTDCLNRVIWPTEYHPENFNPGTFRCFACSSDIATIIDVETTAKALMEENGTGCVLRNEENAIGEPFSGRSVFYVASKADLATLASKVSVLPLRGDPDVKLTLCGKLIRNPAQLFDSLSLWITSRRIEAGECSVCFSSLSKTKLRPACGRKGCHQRVCFDCARDWYGINVPGRIINVAALSCPFCRRRPSPKTVAPFNLTDLAGLRAAVDEAGNWIHAWCVGCSKASRLVERVCAAGAPPEVTNFTCDECGASKQGNVKIRMCPGCGTATERMGGCGHISCPTCHSHWCWFCGEAVDQAEIYNHLHHEHGGLYGDDGDDGYDDEYNSDQED